MDAFFIPLLNGLSAGLLLFMLSAGLTLIFGMMGVLNVAHASFYMAGAYLGYAVSALAGFGAALVLVPLLVGGLGAVFEHAVLRRVRGAGHVPELLITFGLSFVMLELVQLAWGRAPLAFVPPDWLQGAAFTLVQPEGGGLQLAGGAASAEVCAAAACSQFPMTRAFMMAVALLMLASMWLLLARSRAGLVIQAALEHPRMVEALGHDLPRVTMSVFGGGCALAGLAGVVGGATFVTEPAMAAVVGPIVFVVVVVGGMGSLRGALAGSLLIGLLQTLPLSVDASLATVIHRFGGQVTPDTPGWPLLRITLAQAAPSLPYMLLVLVLAFRPQGLLGRHEGAPRAWA